MIENDLFPGFRITEKIIFLIWLNLYQKGEKYMYLKVKVIALGRVSSDYNYNQLLKVYGYTNFRHFTKVTRLATLLLKEQIFSVF